MDNKNHLPIAQHFCDCHASIYCKPFFQIELIRRPRSRQINKQTTNDLSAQQWKCNTYFATAPIFSTRLHHRAPVTSSSVHRTSILGKLITHPKLKNTSTPSLVDRRRRVTPPFRGSALRGALFRSILSIKCLDSSPQNSTWFHKYRTLASAPPPLSSPSSSLKSSLSTMTHLAIRESVADRRGKNCPQVTLGRCN